MYVWWLADTDAPVLVGEINLVERGRRVSMTYDEHWLRTGFALSEDLPLFNQEFIPLNKDTAAGAIDDARPDRWGERIIRMINQPARLSLMEYLYFAGHDRFGALGISLTMSHYVPCPTSPLPVFDNLNAMSEAVRKVLAGQPVLEIESRLMHPGASLGGARPKSLIELEGESWIVKFSEGESVDTPLVEHASMSLARRCGIHTAETRALLLGATGHAVAVRRFDRSHSKRLHVLSANVVLGAANEDRGYPELAQLMRRLAHPQTIKAQQKELFRRMVFNVLIDNTDDHEKNHAFMRDQQGYYSLTPAFDVLPTCQGLRYQQLRVGSQGAVSSLDNALSEAKQFGIDLPQAKQIVSEICSVVDGWKDWFQATGVTDQDIAELGRFIDGDFLRRQRENYSK